MDIAISAAIWRGNTEQDRANCHILKKKEKISKEKQIKKLNCECNWRNCKLKNR
jgi:hypothetical protein